jgi:hypothetical protein
MRRLFRQYPLFKIPCATSTLTLCLYLLQRGFGGGHGFLDPLIAILGFPAFFLLDVLPLPSWVNDYDLLVIIFIPAIINTCLIGLGYGIARTVRAAAHR